MPHFPHDPLVRDDTACGLVGVAALDRVGDVEVVLHVFEGGVAAASAGA